MRVEGGRPVNGIPSELPMQRRGTSIVFFLTMEMNERGYKIKVPIEMHYAVRPIPMGTSEVNSSGNMFLAVTFL